MEASLRSSKVMQKMETSDCVLFSILEGIVVSVV